MKEIISFTLILLYLQQDEFQHFFRCYIILYF